MKPDRKTLKGHPGNGGQCGMSREEAERFADQVKERRRRPGSIGEGEGPGPYLGGTAAVRKKPIKVFKILIESMRLSNGQFHSFVSGFLSAL